MTKTEALKAGSDHLRGEIVNELGNDSPAFTGDTVQLLKFHGMYQQDDRDKRALARTAGENKKPTKHWQMMIRTRIPGGKVSAAGYLAHDAIAGQWGNQTLRLTTRQDFQLYGVLKGDLKSSIRAINQAMMTTLGGCGDQVRNVMCCPAPIEDRLRSQLQGILHQLVGGLTPLTGAYHEIWMDGERVAGPETEPLYGESYLPRKFKVGIAPEGDNCIDIYSNDLGLVAMRDERGELAGFNLLVGGGLGRTNNKPGTYPAVAQPLAWVSPDQALAASQAVVAVQRDHGNRSDRRYARLKYLIGERGLEWFQNQVQSRLDFTLQPPTPLSWSPMEDHLGWHGQADGQGFYGLFVENGRIKDEGNFRLRSGLRQIARELTPTFWITAQQNLLIADLEVTMKETLFQLFHEYGITPTERIPIAVRNSMACPAIPTCGLAVAESERVLPALIRQFDGIFQELGLAEERISVRMTGCPNGCARPYLGDIGLVGTTLGKYDVLLGGDFEGTRLNSHFAGNVPLEELPNLLRPLLANFAEERVADEGFGEWCHRQGNLRLQERFLAGVA
ncbi:MAG: NADPH-dependent assimilatory sulfite reductase hemoprotein subunit [Candidatus Dormibacteraceae bacterium]